MMSSRSIEKFENAAKEAVMSDDVIEHIAGEVALSDQLMKLISVSARDQVYHHVQLRVVEEATSIV